MLWGQGFKDEGPAIMLETLLREAKEIGNTEARFAAYCKEMKIRMRMCTLLPITKQMMLFCSAGGGL